MKTVEKYSNCIFYQMLGIQICALKNFSAECFTFSFIWFTINPHLLVALKSLFDSSVYILFH